MFRNSDEMDMVGHQAPTQQAGLGVLQVLAQEAKVSRAVLIGGEGFAAIDSPLGDVARAPGRMQRLRRGICPRSAAARSEVSEKLRSSAVPVFSLFSHCFLTPRSGIATMVRRLNVFIFLSFLLANTSSVVTQ